LRILLVSERDELKTHIRSNFMPRGAEIIQYFNPIKAMDNLDEIDPDVVLFSAQDFPRHWKPFLIFLRDSRAREQCVFVILTGDEFDHEEADKAQALSVNGIIHEKLHDRAELERLKALVNRYRDIGDARTERRLEPGPLDDVSLVFTHPKRLEIVYGEVKDLSAAGAAFVPADRNRSVDIRPLDPIPVCTLRLGSVVISMPAEVVRNDRKISLSFPSISEAHQAAIRDYVQSHPERELRRLASDKPTEVEPV
jgi:hypothetical protein